ncbi:MAG: translation initiation factor IF-2, partial [Terriglobia bacterium]
YGKVRALLNDKGAAITEGQPSQPMEVLGFSAVPAAGDDVKVVPDEKTARAIAEERALKRRLIDRGVPKHVSLDDLSKQIEEGEIKELNLIVKADVQGSIEALAGSLGKIPQDEVKIIVIHRGVGGISETDVMLAAASNAIIIGFNVRPEAKAKEMAEKEGVDVRTYNVIYKVVEDIEKARTGMLAPIVEEQEIGEIEVRATFRVPKMGVVAGCYVTKGEVKRDANARLVRDGTVVYEGKIASLRRFKDDVASVSSGYECGIGLENFQDIKEGDVIEAFVEVTKPRG